MYISNKHHLLLEALSHGARPFTNNTKWEKGSGKVRGWGKGVCAVQDPRISGENAVLIVAPQIVN